MTEYGPNLTAYVECVVPGGRVTVVGHGGRFLSRHLDVEVAVDGPAASHRWRNKDIVVIGAFVYIVVFIDFADFMPGVPVAHLVLAGNQDDPDFQRAEARAARAMMGPIAGP